MTDEVLDENDPFYAFKRWGLNYRELDAYWEWRHTRDKRDEEERKAKRPAGKDPEPEYPQYKKSGW